ncbi:unnamed protein product [Ectocarpus sp. 8 AP-2014]
MRRDCCWLGPGCRLCPSPLLQHRNPPSVQLEGPLRVLLVGSRPLIPPHLRPPRQLRHVQGLRRPHHLPLEWLLLLLLLLLDGHETRSHAHVLKVMRGGLVEHRRPHGDAGWRHQLLLLLRERLHLPLRLRENLLRREIWLHANLLVMLLHVWLHLHRRRLLLLLLLLLLASPANDCWGWRRTRKSARRASDRCPGGQACHRRLQRGPPFERQGRRRAPWTLHCRPGGR